MHAAAIARSFVNIFFMTFFFQRFNMDVRKKSVVGEGQSMKTHKRPRISIIGCHSCHKTARCYSTRSVVVCAGKPLWFLR